MLDWCESVRTGSRLSACFVICLLFGAMTGSMLAVGRFLLTLAVERLHFLLSREGCLGVLAMCGFRSMSTVRRFRQMLSATPVTQERDPTSLGLCNTGHSGA